jgi:hypothetical protein
MVAIGGLAALTTLATWLVDMILWSIVKSEFNRQQVWDGSYGSAIWLTLAAAALLVFGVCISARPLIAKLITEPPTPTPLTGPGVRPSNTK